MLHTKILSRIHNLLLIATLLSGLLAGENMYRYLMEVPAWRRIGISNWGEYSRNADLKNGVFLLPAEAILSFVLLISASIIALRNKELFASTNWGLHLATVFSTAGLGFTFFAAPYMLSVRSMNDDPMLLQQTFDHFHFWGAWRAAMQILSFFACIWAIEKIFKAEAAKIKSNAGR